MGFLRGFLAAVFLCLSLASPTHAQTAGAPSQPLKVATRIVPPFVFRDKGELTGFSVDLWNALAREASLKFSYVEKDTLPSLFEEARGGAADLAVAAISITAEREKTFDFSQPMFDGGLQIMVSASRANAPSVLPTLIGLFTSRGFQELLGVLAVLMLLPVPLVWLAERAGMLRGGHTLRQLLHSLWWSSSTLAGQATEMPVTFLGRIMAVAWMFVGVVFVSYFTATITAGLTVKQLESGISAPSDLIGKKVATVRGSTAALYLQALGVSIVETNRIDEAYPLLAADQVAAIVYDSPILLYHAAHEGKGRLQMAGPVFRPESYGILFPERSPLRKSINEALLRLKESGEYLAIHQKWFSADKP